jgi:hypothetical protein
MCILPSCGRFGIGESIGFVWARERGWQKHNAHLHNTDLELDEYLMSIGYGTSETTRSLPCR